MNPARIEIPWKRAAELLILSYEVRAFSIDEFDCSC
jgi:hypothetical protein